MLCRRPNGRRPNGRRPNVLAPKRRRPNGGAQTPAPRSHVPYLARAILLDTKFSRKKAFCYHHHDYYRLINKLCKMHPSCHSRSKGMTRKIEKIDCSTQTSWWLEQQGKVLACLG